MFVIKDPSKYTTKEVIEEKIRVDKQVRIIDNGINSWVSLSRNNGVFMQIKKTVFLNSDDT